MLGAGSSIAAAKISSSRCTARKGAAQIQALGAKVSGEKDPEARRASRWDRALATKAFHPIAEPGAGVGAVAFRGAERAAEDIGGLFQREADELFLLHELSREGVARREGPAEASQKCARLRKVAEKGK